MEINYFEGKVTLNIELCSVFIFIFLNLVFVKV